VKALWLSLLASALLWGEVYLLDGTQRTALPEVASPKLTPDEMATLPHVRRGDPTITLQYEGEGYNHRHFNVRLATLDPKPVHTVLTEYSEEVAPGAYRITFSGYRYYGARMLQVYYEGQWHAAILEPLEEESAQGADKTAENAAPDDEPSQVLSYEELDHLLDHLRR
jgi:hypothetical protein